MEALKTLFENLKDRIKTAWAEQMDSEAVVRLREKFEELPAIAQKGIIAGASFLAFLIIMWWPLSNLFDASDFNQKFEDHRQVLKELLQIQRDMATGPNPVALFPASLKSQFDQKIAASGVKPNQITESSETPVKSVSGTEEHGFQFRIEKLTVRQAVDLAYDLEHTDPSLKLLGLEIKNTDPDPHFYQVAFKIVSYSPKLGELPTGSGVIDAIKGKGDKSSAPQPPPPSGDL